jgi:poly(A) polymerase
VRFAARLGFEIDPATMQAARDHADTLELVSAERIADELVRVLTEGSARRGFELMDEAGLLEIVLPEITAMKGVEQDSDFHPEGDVYVHTLACIEQLEAGCTTTLALGLLLHDVAKPPCHVIRDGRHTFHGHTRDGSRMAESICRRLRMSNATIERVSFLVDQHLRHCSARDMKQSTLKRFLGQDGIEELLELVRMDGTSSSSDLGDYQFCIDSLRDLPEEVIKPAPLVTGHDLVEMGMKPGPRFKELLATVEDAQLEGRLETREQALELLRDLLD